MNRGPLRIVLAGATGVLIVTGAVVAAMLSAAGTTGAGVPLPEFARTSEPAAPTTPVPSTGPTAPTTVAPAPTTDAPTRPAPTEAAPTQAPPTATAPGGSTPPTKAPRQAPSGGDAAAPPARDLPGGAGRLLDGLDRLDRLTPGNLFPAVCAGTPQDLPTELLCDRFPSA